MMLNPTLVDDDTKAEFIRSSMRSMSRPARMLARHLAQAHAASVLSDHYYDLHHEEEEETLAATAATD